MSNFDPVITWIFLQVALEAVLVLLMIILFLRLRRLRGPFGRGPEELQAAVERFLSDSERISENFSENLRQKKELSVSLLLALERKINEMGVLMERAEQNRLQTDPARTPIPETPQANPATPESRALVLKLAGRGLSLEDIARKARLNRGEVELILDLEKQFNV